MVKALDLTSNAFVAIKKFKISQNYFAIKKIAKRETRILQSLTHPNIVQLREVITEKQNIYLVFEFVDFTIYELIQNHQFGLSLVFSKKIVYQLLKALNYCHSLKIVHRDIKPENLLISHTGELKICDFGFARSVKTSDVLTEYVSTRWYRAPELLTRQKYGFKVDVWAIGCILAELLTGNPLFPGQNDYDTLCKIVKICGNLPIKLVASFKNENYFEGLKVPCNQEPKYDSSELESMFSSFGKDTVQFLRNCLDLNPDSRFSVKKLLSSPYFEEFYEEKKAKDISPQRIKRNYRVLKPTHQLTYKEIQRRKAAPNEGHKESESQLRLKNDSFVVNNGPVKLPKIYSKDLERLQFHRKSDIIMIKETRYASKSTLKQPFLNSEPHNLSLKNNSTDNLTKLSFENKVLSNRQLRAEANSNVQCPIQTFKPKFSRNSNYFDLKSINLKSFGNIILTPRS